MKGGWQMVMRVTADQKAFIQEMINHIVADIGNQARLVKKCSTSELANTGDLVGELLTLQMKMNWAQEAVNTLTEFVVYNAPAKGEELIPSAVEVMEELKDVARDKMRDQVKIGAEMAKKMGEISRSTNVGDIFRDFSLARMLVR